MIDGDERSFFCHKASRCLYPIAFTDIFSMEEEQEAEKVQKNFPNRKGWAGMSAGTGSEGPTGRELPKFYSDTSLG